MRVKLKPRRTERVAPTRDVADQIYLKDEANARIERWMQNINERFEGFGKISKNDVADFLFRKHPEDLSEDELIEIGNEIYDEVHWLNWALEKITQSKIDGVVLTLGELFARKNGVTAPQTRAFSRSLKRAKAQAPILDITYAQLSDNPDETEVV